MFYKRVETMGSASPHICSAPSLSISTHGIYRPNSAALQKMKRERDCVCQQLGIPDFDLPGFRFHPTEQELVGFYLRNMAQGNRMNFDIIRTLDLYRYDPWELPGLSLLGERELFFFVPRGKNGSGRNNRIAVSGYWKATGSDRQILNGHAQCIGLRKTLVFYSGRAPRGQRTDWVMKEYRMPDHLKPKVEIVVCRIYRKATPLKWLEQRALNHAEDRPSADDADDLDCCNKPPAQADEKLNDNSGIQEALTDPAFEASGECNKCEGLSACRSDGNLGFKDLLDYFWDGSCLDPSLPDLLMDGESIRVEKQLQVAPDLSADYFCSEEALYSHLNLESKYPSREYL